MIDKVGGVILKDKKILVQRKKNNREECIIPGGKREGNETDFETLKRELDEELDVELIKAEFLGGYDDIACFSDEPIHVQTYLAEIKGTIKCKNEINIDSGIKEFNAEEIVNEAKGSTTESKSDDEKEIYDIILAGVECTNE